MPDDPILPIDYPLLAQPSPAIARIDGEIRELAAEMFRVMGWAGGAGLAAVQIGRPVRLVVIDMPDETGTRHRLAMVNPRVVALSDHYVTEEEGCLSMPGYVIPVPRHDRVEVAFQDLEGRDRALTASGPLAICVQHEVDHTNGVLFFDRVSRLRRQRAKDYSRKVRCLHQAAYRPF